MRKLSLISGCLAALFACSSPLLAQGVDAPVLFAPSEAGAVVLLDGRVVCRQTPCALTLPTRTYQIQILKERFLAWEARRELSAGARVAPTLEPSLSTLHVHSAARGAVVRVDGEVVGETPLPPLALEAGLHSVQVEAPCAQPAARALFLEAGQTQHLELEPDARQAWLEVAVVQPNGEALRAELSLDGEPLGQAPGLFQVSACAKELTVQHLALGSQRRALRLRQGRRTQIEVTLGSGQISQARPAPTPAGMVRVDPGSFLLGAAPQEAGGQAPAGRSQVTLTRAFWIQSHETTQEEWAQVMGTNPACYQNCGPQCPVERVSWWDALYYLNQKSERDGLQACYRLERCSGEPGEGCPDPNARQCTGSFSCRQVSFVGLDCKGWRLPTEAEWEYAARAGGAHPGVADVPRIGWFEANSGGATHPVGRKQPNAWGLYDMFGNVSEWVWDGYHHELGGESVDPLGPARTAPGDRAARGGYYGNQPDYLRAGYRHGVEATFRGAGLGLRAVRTAR